MCSRVSPHLNKPYAFICFDTHENAETAITESNDQDLFLCGEKAYVGWALTKVERAR